ncbi:DUF5343 domain-containing protein [Sphingomonas sp. PB2P12]|uniref:DUF5343 domain-containing protein n=1 Tax=Sphingomonas sandaracina TaxID=3096157 RepID=UPI002FC815E4
MALPKSYLTSTKNLGAIFESIQQAKAPERFTTRFLESLEFKSAADRLIIGVLKSLGFLDDQGRPTQRYFSFLDQTQSASILADAVRESYTDIFSVNINAQNLSKSELVNKFKTLSQGSFSESVLDKMATTFQALVKLSDFSSLPHVQDVVDNEHTESDRSTHYDEEPIELRQRAKPRNDRSSHQLGRNLGGLHYNIQIILPETRDPQVYDALFRSLSEHLFG